MFVKPSPNEEAAVLTKERNERRKIRLMQVRDQEKEFARQVRENVKRKKEEERRILEDHIKKSIAKNHQKQLQGLEQILTARKNQIGQAQRDAMAIEKEEQKLQELRLLMSSQQRTIAKKRQLAAMNELTENQLKEREIKDQLHLTRNRALAIERERSKSLVSSNKLESPSLLIMNLEANTCPRLCTRRVQGVEAFASTYFHLPDNLVHRELTLTPYELDATQAAQQVDIEQQHHQKQAAIDKEEQQVKADLRHKHALAQIKLEKEKVALLKDLSILAREDRAQRQHVIHQIPTNLFQPVQQRLQEQEIQQFELEHAFEKLLTKQGHSKLNGYEMIVKPKELSEINESSCTSSDGHSGTLEVETISSPSTNDSHKIATGDNKEIEKEDKEMKSEEQEQRKDEQENKEESGGSSLSISTIKSPQDINSNINSSQSTSVSKLVEMIHNQQLAWQERISNLQSATIGDTVTTDVRSDQQTDARSDISPTVPQENHSLTQQHLSISTLSNSTVNQSSVAPKELSIETLEDTAIDEDETIPSSTSGTAISYQHQPVYYYHPPYYYYSYSTGMQYIPVESIYATTSITTTTGTTPNTAIATPNTAPNTAITTTATNITVNTTDSKPTDELSINTYLSFTNSSNYTSSAINEVSTTDILSSPVHSVSDKSYLKVIDEQRNQFIQSLLASLQDSSQLSAVDSPITSPLKPTHTTSPVPVTSPVVNLSPVTSPVVNLSPVTSPVVNLSPVNSPVVNLSPVTSPVVNLSPVTSPVVNLSPVNSPVVNLSPVTSPVVNLSPVNSPVVNLSPVTSPAVVNQSSIASPSDKNYSPLKVISAAIPSSLEDTAVQTNINPLLSSIESTSKGSLMSSISLQEAFKQRKKSFINKSQARVRDIEVKAKERQHVATVGKDDVTKKVKLVTFSNSVLEKPPVTLKGPPERLFVSKPEKISKRESRQRTERLYELLPEVREKKKEMQRKMDYANNRERAKQYYEAIRKKQKKL